MLGGLVIRVPAERPLTGDPPIPCRALGVLALLEVDCQDRSQGRGLGATVGGDLLSRSS